jgi:hypothetical protein
MKLTKKRNGSGKGKVNEWAEYSVERSVEGMLGDLPLMFAQTLW